MGPSTPLPENVEASAAGVTIVAESKHVQQSISKAKQTIEVLE